MRNTLLQVRIPLPLFSLCLSFLSCISKEWYVFIFTITECTFPSSACGIILDKSLYYKIEVVRPDCTMEALARAVGKGAPVAAAAVTDKGFAKAIAAAAKMEKDR